MYHTRLEVTCNPDFTEILIAELSQANFDTFLETENGFEAYVEEERYDKHLVAEIRAKYQEVAGLSFAFSQVAKKNWNEEWEKSFSPIVVEEKCLIRASFHDSPQRYPYEIIITPKMSFGTGHHQTTWLMVKNMLDMEHVGKRVMDAGCGTVILSILACKLGAQEVEAFDIDEWSVENGNENIEINQCRSVRIQKGRINEVELTGRFDIILANINKNVLLEELPSYTSFLNKDGLLLLSGFLTPDIPDLLQVASECGLTEVKRDQRDTWACLLLKR